MNRRKFVVAMGTAAAGFSAGSRLFAGDDKTPKTAKKKGAKEIVAATRIHQEGVFKATPERVCEALTDAKRFSMATGAPAEISGEAGGAFSCFGGRVVGRTVELATKQRIVQAWRSQGWESGVYSIVRFEITGQGAENRLVLDHARFPDGKAESLRDGWNEHYWGPLGKYLG